MRLKTEEKESCSNSDLDSEYFIHPWRHVKENENNLKGLAVGLSQDVKKKKKSFFNLGYADF